MHREQNTNMTKMKVIKTIQQTENTIQKQEIREK